MSRKEAYPAGPDTRESWTNVSQHHFWDRRENMTASTLTKLEVFLCSLSQFTCLQQAELVIYFMVCPKQGMKEKKKSQPEWSTIRKHDSEVVHYRLAGGTVYTECAFINNTSQSFLQIQLLKEDKGFQWEKKRLCGSQWHHHYLQLPAKTHTGGEGDRYGQCYQTGAIIHCSV